MHDKRVILLHGLLGSPESFDDFVRTLETRDLEIVKPWLPGHGVAPAGLELGSFQAVVERCGREWLSDRDVLVGYSLGGRLALALAAAFPERVRGVVAVGAHTGIVPSAERADRLAWERSLVDDLAQRGLAAFVADWEKQPIFSTQIALSPEILERQRRVRLGHVAEGVAWAIEVLGTGSMPPLLSPLAAGGVPVIFAVGSLDKRAVAIAREAMGVLPRAEVVVVPEAGHNLLLEAPSVVADLTLELVSAPARPRPEMRVVAPTRSA